jgi:SAM-dependent methyltransferase
MMPNSARDDWNAHWNRYAKSAELNAAQRMRHDLVAGLVCETASSSVRVLDIGSGQGDFLQIVRSLLPDAEIVGADVSESGVVISRGKVARATFIVGDIFRSPPALNDFAGWATHAVCSEVLEHVDDPVSFLRLARKYLAPGARLVVTVPGGPVSAFDRHIGHRQHFDRRKTHAMLEQAGYAVERIYLTGFPFFNLYRLLVVARGRRLARDAEKQSSGILFSLTSAMMRLFRFLFHFNLRDSPFGWQVVAVARKDSIE